MCVCACVCACDGCGIANFLIVKFEHALCKCEHALCVTSCDLCGDVIVAFYYDVIVPCFWLRDSFLIVFCDVFDSCDDLFNLHLCFVCGATMHLV